MNALGLDKFAKKLVKDILSSNEDKVNLEEYCEKKLGEKYKNLSRWKIGELSPKFVNKVKSLFDKYIADSENRGIIPEYEFVEYPPNTLFKYDLIHENRFSFIRKHRKEILKTMLKMNWRSFEFLCEHLLKINNILISGVTGGTKEGGVDFYGLLEMNRFATGVLLKDAKIRIIGQAKRYQDVIDDKEVRNFKTHRDELLQNIGRAVSKLPSWFTTSSAPLLSFFIVTTRLTRGAKTYAKANSIILKDGEQVVEDLIKSIHARGWFFRKKGKLFFSEKLFLDFFKKREPLGAIPQAEKTVMFT